MEGPRIVNGCWTSQGYCHLDCDGQHRPKGVCCSLCQPLVGEHCGCCDQFDIEKAIAEDGAE
jgi:hypothetical protein